MARLPLRRPDSPFRRGRAASSRSTAWAGPRAGRRPISPMSPFCSRMRTAGRCTTMPSAPTMWPSKWRSRCPAPGMTRWGCRPCRRRGTRRCGRCPTSWGIPSGCPRRRRAISGRSSQTARGRTSRTPPGRRSRRTRSSSTAAATITAASTRWAGWNTARCPCAGRSMKSRRRKCWRSARRAWSSTPSRSIPRWICWARGRTPITAGPSS